MSLENVSNRYNDFLKRLNLKKYFQDPLNCFKFKPYIDIYNVKQRTKVKLSTKAMVKRNLGPKVIIIVNSRCDLAYGPFWDLKEVCR